MISVESKTQTSTSSSPLSIAPQKEGETASLSFSELLKGASGKKDEKTIQNGALLLSLGEESGDAKDAKISKADMLLSLLKGESTKEGTPALELNPAITKELTPKELKALVLDAKKYLKTKIIESEGFKKSEIASLPKTLKGLAEVAKKFGIDVSKITLQEVKPESKTTTKTELKIESKELGTSIASKETKAKEGEAKVKQASSDADVVVELDVKTAPKKAKVAPTVAASQKASQNAQDEDANLTQTIKTEVKSSEVIKETKATPLFKAQTKAEITTEQIVNAKVSSTTELRTPKQKSDETLKMLLRGEKVTQKDAGFTADFSVATARVIAPGATTDARKTLETLLRGESGDTATSSKTDGLNMAKADSFEVKLNEAKQMTKYLSADVKSAIEDYKSPFTRVKVQLNPQKLGDIDLTIVQRGKNLHINLTSNNAAINTLALNANDLKAQLANNGINNASLNFNNNSESSQQNSFGQQQQNSQHEREAGREYEYFENEELNEEILDSLEIVVPHYA